MAINDLGERGRSAIRILRKDGFSELFQRALKLNIRKVRSLLFDSRLFIYKLLSDDGRQHAINLDGFDLFVNLNDTGLSHDLLRDGVREPISSTTYRRELRNLDARTDETVNVLEVGAHIGYYALMPFVECDNVHVYAVEAEPENYEFLRDNIRLNNANGYFTAEHVAFGDKNGETELTVSDQSNRHSFQDLFHEESSHRVSGKITVPMRRGEDWLADHDVEISDIDVLRMDVEGFEATILETLPGILNHIELLHLEVHPKLMENDALDDVLEMLKTSGLEIVVAARNADGHELDSLDDIRKFSYMELVARRGE